MPVWGNYNEDLVRKWIKKLIMRRTIGQVMSTADMKGIPIASKAVLIKGKLRGCQYHIPCEIPQDYHTSFDVLPRFTT
jgi:hypothetical protein